MRGEPYVFVTRGERIESVHHVAACIAADDGTVTHALGDIDEPVFLRSSAKPFIAAAIVASGAAARFGFDAREIAVMAASHNGEPFHVAAVESIFAKIGLTPDALQCGAHAPSYEPAATVLAASGAPPTALHNNCSGKHAGILALCVHLGLDPRTYTAYEHPAQQRILAFCARLLGEEARDMPIGIDGCGIPVFATSLRHAARAFARVATLASLEDADAAALVTVRDAMTAEPAYVAGSDRFDSALSAVTGGRIVGKAGAEGVHADALRREGLGLVLKVIDGTRRAAAPATMGLLAAAGALDPPETAALQRFARPEVRNVTGRVVGTLGPLTDTIPGRVTS
ncbi:MAG: asparaginase [Vulcanimicrobiaceae bacterium]